MSTLDRSRAERARTLFDSTFKGEPAGVAIAPGRVNVIGEHTDYNDGFVLPIAIDRAVTVAYRPRADRTICVRSTLSNETVSLNLDALDKTGWAAYVAGVASVLEPHAGAELLIDSDLPSGAGLSSSAALEVATCMAFGAMSGAIWDTHMAATACRRAENEFVGVASGIMDQFASAASRAGQAMLLDCRSLETDFIAVPEAGTVVVMDTGIRRKLSASQYNDRRAACERVVAYFRVKDPAVRALRDVTEEQLEHAQRKLDLSDFHRAWHVVAENHRVQMVAQAFRERQPRHVGAALNVSHDSLRELYDVSCDELDTAVEIARDHSACFGARMTGAGFGGCALAYVATDAAEKFVSDISPLLGAKISPAANAFVCIPAQGARLAR